MKSKIILHDEEKDIINYYLSSNTLNATAKKFGRSPNTIKNLLIKNDIDIRSSKDDYKLAYNCRKQTNLLKYGHENVGQFGSSEFVSSIINHYGTDNCMKNSEVREQVKITCREHFGVDCNLASKNPELNGQATLLKKYGVTKNSQTATWKESVTNTWAAKTPEEKLAIIKKILKTKNNSKHISAGYTCNGLSFDSFPELAFYIYTCLNGAISIKREPTVLFYTYENKQFQYIPDFEIDGQLYEIKAKHWLKNWNIDGTKDNAKYNCMINHNVIILWEKDYKFYTDWFIQHNWDLNDFKKTNLNERSATAAMADLLN